MTAALAELSWQDLTSRCLDLGGLLFSFLQFLFYQAQKNKGYYHLHP